MKFKLWILVISYILIQSSAHSNDINVDKRIDLMVQYGYLSPDDALKSKHEMKKLSSEEKNKINEIFRTISSIEETNPEPTKDQKP